VSSIEFFLSSRTRSEDAAFISSKSPSRSILHRPTTIDAEKTATTTHEESNKDLDSQLGHFVNAEDHEYGEWRTIRKNSWAFALCMYSVWVVLLVSFESQASSTVLGVPEFGKGFGSYVDNQYVINSTLARRHHPVYPLQRKFPSPISAICIH
jgi:hypothetical protein